MDNIYDYLYWRGDLSFDIVDPTEVDFAIFSILSYIDFIEDLKLEENGKILTIAELTKIMDESKLLIAREGTPSFKIDCLELLPLLALKNRYKDVQVFAYSYNFEKDNALQFAAVSFRLPNDEIIVSYRGTDASLVGWKEDFMMSFKKSVGAQEYGREYLERLASIFDGTLTLVGHSKGGNIALYSALMASSETQNRIAKVYSFDGPGFNKKTLQEFKKCTIKDKMVTLVPQGSVIGILMQHEEPIEIVYSNKKNGITQHMPFSWQVNIDTFSRIDRRDTTSLMFDKSIRVWLEKLSEEDMENFIDSVFESTDAVGLEHFHDLKLKPIKTIYNVLSTYAVNNIKTRKLIERIVGSLFSAMKEVSVLEYKNKKEALKNQFKKNKSEIVDTNLVEDKD
ncbi:MAG: DUF2974 domain-containing protein [Sphaerochaetaceae bacterium]|nr:DUF2974 domain-containing protein [Sphaerochaetaceae bacterium]